MTTAEVRKIVPQNSEVRIFNPTLLPDSNLQKIKGFEDVESAHFTFRWAGLTGPDEILDGIKLRYRSDAEWDSLYEYTDHVAPLLGIPSAAFARSMSDPNAMEAKCDGFKVTLRSNYVSLESTEISDAVKAEKERQKGEKKKAFKP